VDLVNEREREAAAFKARELELRSEADSLRQQLETTKEEAQAKSQINSEELLQRLETEKANIHTEYEQERIAYQKLLKAYNRLEVQYENLQVSLATILFNFCKNIYFLIADFASHSTVQFGQIAVRPLSFRRVLHLANSFLATCYKIKIVEQAN
jgi:uncharacterized protein (DUF3084 family)